MIEGCTKMIVHPSIASLLLMEGSLYQFKSSIFTLKRIIMQYTVILTPTTTITMSSKPTYLWHLTLKVNVNLK